MANCEMCGKESGLVNALIEGVELKVCKTCASFGKILKKPVIRTPAKKVQALPERELVQIIREDFSNILREKREKMGLKQKEFAKYLSERESIIHKMESGTYVPSIETARKLEKQLSIKLIEEKEIAQQNLKEKKESYTIGDMIKLK